MRTVHLRRLAIGFVVWFISCSDGTAPPETQGALARRLAVSEQVVCALNATGVVYCWGTNSTRWEFGVSNDVTAGSGSPVTVPVPKLVSLGTGLGTHFCGINNARDAVCWGRNQYGELGAGVPGTIGHAAITVSGSKNWADISIGRITTCGETEDGGAFCWGINQSGEIGNNTIPINGPPNGAPVPVSSPVPLKRVFAGWLHACGLSATGSAYCWGQNTSGQLGLGATDSLLHLVPEPVSGGHTFLLLSLGSRYTCGLTTDSTAFCWGENGTGQLGDGSTTQRQAPTAVASNLKFIQLSTSSGFAEAATAPVPVTLQGGVGHTCAVAVGGAPYCWGWNGDGQLGDGTTTDSQSPVAVSGSLTLEVIGNGSASTCGMKGNAIWCWGSNARGQLGTVSFASSSVPVQVGPPFNNP